MLLFIPCMPGRCPQKGLLSEPGQPRHVREQTAPRAKQRVYMRDMLKPRPSHTANP